MKIAISAVLAMALTSSAWASIPLPKECAPFVKSDSVELVTDDILKETNGIASICSLLEKNLKVVTMAEDDNSTKSIYLREAMYSLEDLKKFDIAVDDSQEAIDKEIKRLNNLLRMENLIYPSDKETIYVALAKEDDEASYLMKYIYEDGDIRSKKSLHYNTDLIDNYPALSRKFGLIEEKKAEIVVSKKVTSEDGYRYIVSRKVNVRVSPSTRYTPIAQLEHQYEVLPSKHDGQMIVERGFVKIHFDDTFAWVAKSNIVKKKD
ncbi:MAG: hypothetical protein DRG30_06395 [Epsilonproteobacteria bacterium]|nr:MAG: hypothetical protein DRG30_06395 [Campylobacterota bacterium]